MSFEAKKDDVICTAGTGTKCKHKENTAFLGGQIKGVKCGLMSGKGHTDPEKLVLCSKAGGTVE